jgi:cell division protein FtsB
VLSRLRKPRLTTILLVALLLLQFPLWFGQGGWIRVWRLEQQMDAKIAENQAKQQRVRELEAEVRGFKDSPRAAEERARYELGLIQPGERFVQWGTPQAQDSANAASSQAKGLTKGQAKDAGKAGAGVGANGQSTKSTGTAAGQP